MWQKWFRSGSGHCSPHREPSIGTLLAKLQILTGLPCLPGCRAGAVWAKPADYYESALLVNVDNATLQKLLDNPEALSVLMSIEGFRNLNRDIETIINKSEAVKKAKKDRKDKTGTEKEKKELSQEEKEFNNDFSAKS